MKGTTYGVGVQGFGVLEFTVRVLGFQVLGDSVPLRPQETVSSAALSDYWHDARFGV